MFVFFTNLLVVLMAAFLFVSVASAEVSDELEGDAETEASLRLDLNQEISSQEKQIESILKILNRTADRAEVSKSEEQSNTLYKTVVSKK